MPPEEWSAWYALASEYRRALRRRWHGKSTVFSVMTAYCGVPPVLPVQFVAQSSDEHLTPPAQRR